MNMISLTDPRPPVFGRNLQNRQNCQKSVSHGKQITQGVDASADTSDSFFENIGKIQKRKTFIGYGSNNIAVYRKP